MSRPAGREPRLLIRWWRRQSLRTRLTVITSTTSGCRSCRRRWRSAPGDTLRETWKHDAGLRKQLPQLSKLPPRYVVWGDGTADEMCIGIMTVSPRKS